MYCTFISQDDLYIGDRNIEFVVKHFSYFIIRSFLKIAREGINAERDIEEKIL